MQEVCTKPVVHRKLGFFHTVLEGVSRNLTDLILSRIARERNGIIGVGRVWIQNHPFPSPLEGKTPVSVTGLASRKHIGEIRAIRKSWKISLDRNRLSVSRSGWTIAILYVDRIPSREIHSENTCGIHASRSGAERTTGLASDSPGRYDSVHRDSSSGSGRTTDARRESCGLFLIRSFCTDIHTNIDIFRFHIHAERLFESFGKHAPIRLGRALRPDEVFFIRHMLPYFRENLFKSGLAESFVMGCIGFLLIIRRKRSGFGDLYKISTMNGEISAGFLFVESWSRIVSSHSDHSVDLHFGYFIRDDISGTESFIESFILSEIHHERLSFCFRISRVRI